MIKPEDVPNEVVKAYREAWLNGSGGADAAATALNAWPGANSGYDLRWFSEAPALILPLKDSTNDV